MPATELPLILCVNAAGARMLSRLEPRRTLLDALRCDLQLTADTW